MAAPSLREKSLREKMFQAEQRMAGVRLLVIAAGFIYPLFMEKAGTVPGLAYMTLSIAWAYGIYIFLGQPYRKYPVLLSSYFTTFTDAVLVTVWLYATGSYYSPFYVLIYPAMMSVAIRYSVTEIAIAALVYAGSYLTLIAASGQLTGHATEIIVRVTYIFLTAALGAQISREIMDQTRTKTELKDQMEAGEMRAQMARQTEQEIQRLNAQLELRVAQRTQELKEAVRQLEQSNQDLEQFAYVASHDLQEPLRMVSSFVELLRERYNDTLDDKGRQYIHFAVDAAQRMKGMIDGLLALSRVERQGVPFVSLTLESVIRDVKQNLNLLIQENRAVIEIPSPLPTIRGDRAQMVQLFQNLISNAIKFKKVGAPPRITITADASPPTWIISVADNGIGIEPEYSDRIFAIFQKLHPPGQYPGTGIGLAVAKKIVERHGGFIGVKSRPGEGATFIISLPQDPKPPV